MNVLVHLLSLILNSIHLRNENQIKDSEFKEVYTSNKGIRLNVKNNILWVSLFKCLQSIFLKSHSYT